MVLPDNRAGLGVITSLENRVAFPRTPHPTLSKNSRVTIVTIVTRVKADPPCAKSMPPIITVDTSTSPDYINAHPSTYGLTTLLLNDQLVLVEVQGTLEYNVTNGEEPRDVRLGDITWDETVCSTTRYILIADIKGLLAYWSS